MYRYIVGTIVFVLMSGCMTQQPSESSSSRKMPSSYPSSSSSSSESSNSSEEQQSDSDEDDGGEKSSGNDEERKGGKRGSEQESGGSQSEEDGEIASAARVFKEAQEQRKRNKEDPWAESSESEEEEESDWIVTGGGGQQSEEESEETSEGQPSDGGQPGGSEVADSPGQRSRDLQEEFEKSLKDFDGMIIDERAIIIADSNRGAYQRELPELPEEKSQEQGGGGLDGDESQDTVGGEVATASGTSNIPTRLPPKNTDRGDYTPQQIDRIPVDIPSGDDDDILASQLREAAIIEQDDELRERLWEEYRRYKKSTVD